MELASLSYLEVTVDDAFLVTVLHSRHNLDTRKTDNRLKTMLGSKKGQRKFRIE